jgi:hypothetical protein
MTTTPTWAEHLTAPRPSLTRELGERAASALIEENLGTPAERAAAIADRATRALAVATGQEHQRQDTFVQLNPDFGVLPDAHDPDQHQFAHRRERALALGTRVHLAEARENSGNPELAVALVRERAEQAARLAQDHRPAERRATQRQRARAGAER